MASTLPTSVVLKANYSTNYLRYIAEDGDQQKRGYNQFSGTEIWSPLSKYEIIMANTGKGLVHVRCCSSRKYWVSKSSTDDLIVSTADDPEEDQTKWSCTLFKPETVNGDAKNIKLLHVHCGKYLRSYTSNNYKECLCTNDSSATDKYNSFTVFDWESLVVLPRYVTFKGVNDQYVAVRWIENHNYLQLNDYDILHPFIGYEIFTMGDGRIRIKSTRPDIQKFWRFTGGWIWADSTDTAGNDETTYFQPIKFGDNVIALKSSRGTWCGSVTTEGKTNCFQGNRPTADSSTRLVVSERVLSREIYNVEFDLAAAKIFGTTVSRMDRVEHVNLSSGTNNAFLKVKHSESRSSTWNSSMSMKFGVKVSLSSGVPLIVETGIEISPEITFEYQMGETKQETDEAASSHAIEVPPRTKVIVNVLQSRSTCDIPFSYTQRDTLSTTGEVVTERKHDGLYTGVNSYNVDYETLEEQIPADAAENEILSTHVE